MQRYLAVFAFFVTGGANFGPIGGLRQRDFRGFRTLSMIFFFM